jgi:elongation factor G
MIALVGPAGAGKTTLLEALLYASGTIDRQAPVGQGSVGDATPEARARGVSVELNLAHLDFMGDRYAVVDAPGAPDFAHDADAALPACDLALVVVDPDPAKALLTQPAMRRLEDLGVPRAVFVNKIDQARGRTADLLAALQTVSAQPLVARQLVIQDGEKITGYVDLALERAFAYRQGKPSERIDIPAEIAADEADARFHMLEQLADHDDALMEQLLSDETPSLDSVFADLVRETQEGLVVPVFFGSAQNGHGVRRLLKALRHDTPPPEVAAARLGAEKTAYVFKTAWAGHAGKLAYARTFTELSDGSDLTLPDGSKARVGGLFCVQGQTTTKLARAAPGEAVAIGKVEEAQVGRLLSANGPREAPPLQRRTPVYSFAVSAKERKDDVRLSGALAKIVEEDAGLELRRDPRSDEILMSGQGEAHLRCALDRMRRRFGVEVKAERPRVAYRETIRASVTKRGRHKKQTGGHGQFGDVVLEVSPLPRGDGFRFSDRITGGVVPKQWIPAVEQGVRDAMEKGPIGYPATDVAAVLTDGSWHAVDSSEIAFRTAGRIAMLDALAEAKAYLLEPIEKLAIHVPSSSTSKITSAISSRRGQILGFDARAGWPGWDTVEAFLPEAERHDLIAEIRALTQGLGTFEAAFDHMAELSGREAEAVAKAARMEAA